MSNIVETWFKPSYFASEKMYRTTRKFFRGTLPFLQSNVYPPPPPPFHALNLPVKRLYHYNETTFYFSFDC